MKMKRTDTPTEPLPPLQAPNAPLIERDENNRGAVSLTAEGLRYVEYLASEFCTVAFIASKLGIGQATFKKLLGNASADPISDVRASYEAGRAALETEVNRAHLQQIRRGNAITPMFVSKSEFGKRESGDPVVNINSGNNIGILPGNLSPEITARILKEQNEKNEMLPPEQRQHLLPGSKTEAEMLAELGMTAPIDLSGDAYADAMKDITPPKPSG
jgi:hypothetical protein